MNYACGEAPPNHRRARLQSCHICTPTENDLTGHLCKQPQFHFKIGSFLMVDLNVFATPLSSCVTEWWQNARSGLMKSMWSFSHHLCTHNEQNSSCDGGHIEDAGCPKSPLHFETEIILEGDSLRTLAEALRAPYYILLLYALLICILWKRSATSPSLVSHCLSRSKNLLFEVNFNRQAKMKTFKFKIVILHIFFHTWGQ